MRKSKRQTVHKSLTAELLKRRSVQTLGEGEGSLTVTPTGGAQECHLYLAGNRSPRFSGGNERSHNRFEKNKSLLLLCEQTIADELILRFQVRVQLKQNVKETAEPHD